MRKKTSKSETTTPDEVVTPPTSKKPKKEKVTKAKADASIGTDEFNKMLREALIEHAEKHSRITNNYLDAMCSVLEEFMQTFVLLGYNLDGEPVTIVNALTPRDADALSAAVNRFFMQHNQGFEDFDEE